MLDRSIEFSIKHVILWDTISAEIKKDVDNWKLEVALYNVPDMCVIHCGWFLPMGTENQRPKYDIIFVVTLISETLQRERTWKTIRGFSWI